MNNKGITLVALTVTIVVMIILAGVSINLAVNDNGIVSHSEDAAEDTYYSSAKEQILEAVSMTLGKYDDFSDSGAINYLCLYLENSGKLTDVCNNGEDYNIIKFIYEPSKSNNLTEEQKIYYLVDDGTKVLTKEEAEKDNNFKEKIGDLTISCRNTNSSQGTNN